MTPSRRTAWRKARGSWEFTLPFHWNSVKEVSGPTSHCSPKDLQRLFWRYANLTSGLYGSLFNKRFNFLPLHFCCYRNERCTSPVQITFFQLDVLTAINPVSCNIPKAGTLPDQLKWTGQQLKLHNKFVKNSFPLVVAKHKLLLRGYFWWPAL